MRLITSHELHDRKLNTHRFMEGYDMDDTDDLLREAEDTLAAYEHGAIRLTPRQTIEDAAMILRHQFSQSKHAQRTARYLQNISKTLKENDDNN